MREVMNERAPWYIIATRIFITLIFTALSFAIVFLNYCAAIVVIDKTTGWNIQGWILDICEKYPTESIILTIVAYIIWTGALINNIVRYLTGRK